MTTGVKVFQSPQDNLFRKQRVMRREGLYAPKVGGDDSLNGKEFGEKSKR